ncbi:hypothetical protein CGRA01v4_02864 [Colletotrichum graminicola]|nr:hypothetical protein CGRA01v4_02864 [Colletotrichum graminicola]
MGCGRADLLGPIASATTFPKGVSPVSPSVSWPMLVGFFLLDQPASSIYLHEIPAHFSCKQCA